MMFKGKFEVFEQNKNGMNLLGESPNRMMYDGQEFLLDQIFGIESWFSGALGYDGSLPASGAWHPYRWIALGTNVDDNSSWLVANSAVTTGVSPGNGANITGGTGIKTQTITTSDLAHFPNMSDTHMSSLDVGKANNNVGSGLFYKLADRIIRTGRTITIEATFTTDSNINNGTSTVIPTGTKIRELGIFLAEPTGVGNPSTVRSDRTGTIISKSVRYTVSGTYVEDNPIVATVNNLTVRYTFGDF